tara:strand:+ start:747 stop:905 length:159 start_codon:yes stop_codon:yes gene_type:complete
METVAVTLGTIFVGIIILCLIGTIGSYIADAYAPNNKLEENIKKLEKKNSYK